MSVSRQYFNHSWNQSLAIQLASAEVNPINISAQPRCLPNSRANCLIVALTIPADLSLVSGLLYQSTADSINLYINSDCAH